MKSCYIIYNKSENNLSFNDFLHEYPQVLGNICEQAKESIETILERSKLFSLLPGENYIDSDIEDQDYISKNIGFALLPNIKNKSSNFEWKEVYNEEEF